MTTSELIARLRELDPGGKLPVHFVSIDATDDRLETAIESNNIRVKWVWKPGFYAQICPESSERQDEDYLAVIL